MDATQPPVTVSRRTLAVASVSYLNARPLIDGLQAQEDLSLALDVPARLIDGLREGRYDVALLPVIDYQRMAGLRVIPSGGIGCDGETLTVRVFSHVPPGEVTALACDPESHTSVALAHIIFRRLFNRRPEFIPLTEASNRPGEARLLIGDKVVCEEPAGFEHQLDLGAAWKTLTGLPFVFAVWMVRAGVSLGDLPDRLSAARRRGLENLPEIIRRYAVPRGWPPGLALQYLSVYLKYEIGPRQLEAIGRFHAMAAELGLVGSPARPLDVV